MSFANVCNGWQKLKPQYDQQDRIVYHAMFDRLTGGQHSRYNDLCQRFPESFPPINHVNTVFCSNLRQNHLEATNFANFLLDRYEQEVDSKTFH